MDRAACERRVYRLATLLTGNPNAATRVIEAVVDAQPDLAHLDNAHMDRLTVLRSREVEGGTLVDARVPTRVAEAVYCLPPQPREAWVFTRVYMLPDRAVARAMDCSVTATLRHLAQADQGLAGRQVDPGQAAEALLAYSLALDVPSFYRAARQRRRRLRLVLLAGLIVVALAAIIGALRLL